MGILSAADILKHADDIPVERVHVPEWGGEVIVRGMTGRERDAWEASMYEQRGKRMIPTPDNSRAKLVVRCVIDEDGKRIFHDGQIDEIGELGALALNRVSAVAARLSGIGEGDLEAMTEDFGSPNGSASSSGKRRSATQQSGGS